MFGLWTMFFPQCEIHTKTDKQLSVRVLKYSEETPWWLILSSDLLKTTSQKILSTLSWLAPAAYQHPRNENGKHLRVIQLETTNESKCTDRADSSWTPLQSSIRWFWDISVGWTNWPDIACRREMSQHHEWLYFSCFGFSQVCAYLSWAGTQRFQWAARRRGQCTGGKCDEGGTAQRTVLTVCDSLEETDGERDGWEWKKKTLELWCSCKQQREMEKENKTCRHLWTAHWAKCRCQRAKMFDSNG